MKECYTHRRSSPAARAVGLLDPLIDIFGDPMELELEVIHEEQPTLLPATTALSCIDVVLEDRDRHVANPWDMSRDKCQSCCHFAFLLSAPGYVPRGREGEARGLAGLMSVG